MVPFSQLGDLLERLVEIDRIVKPRSARA
jgi:hypothetical protein